MKDKDAEVIISLFFIAVGFVAGYFLAKMGL